MRKVDDGEKKKENKKEKDEDRRENWRITLEKGRKKRRGRNLREIAANWWNL